LAVIGKVSDRNEAAMYASRSEMLGSMKGTTKRAAIPARSDKSDAKIFDERMSGRDDREARLALAASDRGGLLCEVADEAPRELDGDINLFEKRDRMRNDLDRPAFSLDTPPLTWSLRRLPESKINSQQNLPRLLRNVTAHAFEMPLKFSC
jgi:hypothetical protein